MIAGSIENGLKPKEVKPKAEKKLRQKKCENCRRCWGFLDFLKTSWRLFKEFSADTSIHGENPINSVDNFDDIDFFSRNKIFDRQKASMAREVVLGDCDVTFHYLLHFVDHRNLQKVATFASHHQLFAKVHQRLAYSLRCCDNLPDCGSTAFEPELHYE